MGFQFQPSSGKPEWLPDEGHYILGVYQLEQIMKDFKDGKGPQPRAQWGWVVIAGPQTGRRVVDETSFAFFDGGRNPNNASTVYRWVKALVFKGAPPPPDYMPDSDEVTGRIAQGTCANDAKGWMHVSKDLLPVKTLPDGLTIEAINAIMAKARAEHAAAEAERAANGNGNGQAIDFAPTAPVPATFDPSAVPF